MMEIEATDRYGGNYPDPATVCEGPCEGMGMYPAYSAKYDTRTGSDVCRPVEQEDDTAAIEASDQTPGDDGWLFLTCADCGGTGVRKP